MALTLRLWKQRVKEHWKNTGELPPWPVDDKEEQGNMSHYMRTDHYQQSQVRVILLNRSGELLLRSDKGLQYGGWKFDLPARVEPDTSVAWASGTTGMTGTQGFGSYYIEDSGEKLFIEWKNPKVGANKHRVRIENENKFRWETKDGWGQSCTYWVVLHKVKESTEIQAGLVTVYATKETREPSLNIG